jgi:protein tyrosine phosphatase (PTP) superfamily phosphohydrolase (DUF442 family)
MAKYTNTAKSILGFIRAFLGRRFSLRARDETLNDICNYLPIENLYATSGQPSEAQFGLIKDAGYETVINLAPTSIIENSVVEEEEILAALGLAYLHIPVDFNNPTERDFQAFTEGLKEAEKVWVHCAANMRVSAFTYRYRTVLLGEDEDNAMSDLQKIWQPFGVWSEFIQR